MISSCSFPSIEEDLATICGAMNIITTKENISEEERLVAFMEVLPSLNVSKETNKFLNQVFAKSSVSFEDFKIYAAENGIENWSCHSLESLFKE